MQANAKRRAARPATVSWRQKPRKIKVDDGVMARQAFLPCRALFGTAWDRAHPAALETADQQPETGTVADFDTLPEETVRSTEFCPHHWLR